MAGKSAVPTNFTGARFTKPFRGTSVGFHFWHCFSEHVILEACGEQENDPPCCITAQAGFGYFFPEIQL